MKCLVCGKEFQGTECPICHFPIVEIPGDYESGLRTLQPVIKSHRDAFVEKISVGVVTFEYEIENGMINEKGMKQCSFGTVTEMMNQIKWLDTVFENPMTRKSMDITIIISIDGMRDEQRTVSVPILKTEGKISLGIFCDDTLHLCLKVKDEKGQEATSEKIAIVR